ncbi:sensor histidine kinase [Mucilaginibacter kameinonensis]|uniref:sensor histidine kinase n=1 Tax=Mucilaginibacter kameinonensis TaxID=452286 RepID=UPI000EF76C4C|nr:two-component regulator propeller domain-containing protein [Mucilaginibacter kameinonensis]
MKKITMLILCCCISLYAGAQSAHLYFDRLDIKKGLPESNVGSLLEDSQGYMWFSTQNGLVRYDGYRYKIYKLGSPKLNKQVSTLVFNVIEDKNKTLWITTLANGIFKYNRATDSFTQYPYPANLTYGQLIVGTIDNDGNLWGRFDSATSGQNMMKFEPVTGQYLLFSNRQKGIYHIRATVYYNPVKTADGSIWFGSNNGIYRYNGAGKGFSEYLASNDTAKMRAANPIYEAPSEPGVLYMNTFHGHDEALRFARYDIGAGKLIEYGQANAKDSLLSAGIYSFYEDKSKHLWIGTNKGLSKFDRQTRTFSNYTPVDTINSATKNQFIGFRETQDGKLWISSSAGLVYFDPITSVFKRYVTDPDDPGALPSLGIGGKTIDHTNTLWLGFGNAGVARINKLKSAFTIFKNNPAKAGTYPGKLVTLKTWPNGDAWLTTRQGIYKGNIITNQYKKIYNVASNEGFFPGFCYGQNNILYVATESGLLVYNTITGKKEKYSNIPGDSTSIISNYVHSLFQDHTGILWIAADIDAGICSFNPVTKKFTRYPYRGSYEKITSKNKYALDDSRAITFYEDHENTLWIGTNFGGLNRFDRKTGRFISYFNNDMRKAACVDNIFEDKAGRLWVGTYLDGLFLFDRKKEAYVRHFNEDSGLIFNSVMGINEDNDGRLWVITERGFTRIDPRTMTLKNFFMDDILPGKDIFRGIDNVNRLADGRMLFPLSNGIAVFNPKDLNDNPYAPVVHIESVAYSNPKSSGNAINNVLTYGRKTLELPYDQNRVQLNFVGLQYDNPEQNIYAYKLDGYDKNWVQAGTNRSVTYNNLSAGTYVFHVRAANSSGVWNKTGDSITIVIATAWYLRWWAWLIYIVLFASAIYAFIAYRSRQLKYENQLLEEKVKQRTDDLSRANKELSEQQEEIITQRDQLADAVDNLKTTQQQLIQAEKLASLGELTAGIAHEIQNPLNFVNNFSEVSMELIDEMETELTNGDAEEAKAIAADVKLNLEKIHHHGKRADAIVKNMLQHSRAGSGSKEQVNINNLTGEYFKLAYNGLRAKDKTFNSALVTNFDDSLPLVNIVQQDIGRVLLNLYNNAFYAVHQKQKTAGEAYKPEVIVTTAGQSAKAGAKSVVITVRDNGMGIPDNIKEKIMQPFFTTKPTGQGTGLGLSLSYDIVVKGHGGKIDIESKEGEYTVFTITLPVG